MKNKIMAFRDVYILFLDVWSLYQKYSVTNLSDTECVQLQEEVAQIQQKYNSTLANDILVAMLGELSRLAKIKEQKRRRREEVCM